jgi:hypothetical protein
VAHLSTLVTTPKLTCNSSTPTTSAPSLLTTSDYTIPRHRSRSREPRPRVGPRPPRPTVEDEAVSLSRESSASSAVPSYDPPLRGIIEQNPVILEANVTAAEAARLHATPHPKDDENPERRFVFIPHPDSDNEASQRREPPPTLDSRRQEPQRREEEKLAPRPQIERRRSRQDLPSLVTKVPRDIPPQFRRSASAVTPISRDIDLTPRQPAARTPGAAAGEHLLSPDIPRGKDYFGTAGSRSRGDSVGARNGVPVADKRRSGGDVPGLPYPGSTSEKRNSGNFEKPRSRSGTNEKMTRPQHLSEEEYRRSERHTSTHSARLSTGSIDRRSGRSSPHSQRRHESSESDIADSDSERGHRHRHHRHRELEVENTRRRSSSRSNHRIPVDSKPRYKNSPLPSPKVSPSQLPVRGVSPRGDRERAETFPQRSGSRSPGGSRPVSPFSPTDETPRPYDRLDPMDAAPTHPRSRRRQSHSSATPISTPTGSNFPPTLPISIPSSNRPAEASRLPSFPAFDENRAQGARPADSSPYWQPPPFQPNNLDTPVGTYRRYSEDIESGSIAPLPACPRTEFVRGRNDWLTLPGGHGQSFDMCPSCFKSTIAPTEFHNAFVLAPRRPPDSEVICDFGSSPWFRIAWLLTRKERRRDLSLFYGLSKVAATTLPCLGKHQAARQWHSIIDPKTRTPIQNFSVCQSCVKSIEVLLPPLRGIFVKTDPRRPTEDQPLRVCDLRFDSKRFIQYFDALETTADKADEEDAPPNTRALVSLVKRFAAFPECQRSKDLVEARWNVITQLPEFTVCAECFEDVVWPELEEGKPIPMMFHKSMQRISKASCQLYSPKMRGIFRTAVDGDDYKLLASKARERKAVEMAYKANLKAGGNPRASSEFGTMDVKRVEEEWRKWE